MTAELIWELAKIAMDKGPAIAKEIREWIGKGTTGEADAARFDKAVEILKKNPEDYFGPRKPDIDPPGDPNPEDVRYASRDEAIAHLQGSYIFVLEYEDGRFGIWPNIGPLPGKKVYPSE